MSTHKYIDRICVAAVVLSLLLTLLFMNGEALGLQSAGTVVGYENRLFDTTRVHTIDIVMDDWDDFIETCQNEEYSPCNVVIDGESYKNVGIRAKGNTSLSSVAAMGSSRYSFKIEFDQYDSTKSYHGLDKLCLNNLIQDNTMMKDYLTYQMMNAFGVPSSLSSFVYITVNGEDWGLYLAVEGVEEAFLQRSYGNDYGELYKPDSMSLGGGRGNGRDFDPNDFTAPLDGEGGNTPAPSGQKPDFGSFDSSAMFGGGGGFGFGSASDVKLQYIDDDPDSYSNIFNSAKTDVSKTDQARLIASLKSLSSYEDLEEVLDMEAVLRYFVVHNFVVNGDSYTGSMIHNYYLYEKDGRLSMIPWDYNLAFGTFIGGTATSSVNDAIDDVLSDRPMQAWIFSDASYTQQYHDLFADFLHTVDAAQIIHDAYALIGDYVKKDPTKFCTYEEFETGIQTLLSFCSLRRESVQGQLAGTIPSNSEAQNAQRDTQVNADNLDLSDMGTMSHGGMGGGPGGFDKTGRGDRMPLSVQDEAADDLGETNGAPSEPETPDSAESFPFKEQRDNRGFSPPEGSIAPPNGQISSTSQQSVVVLLCLSVITLLIGLVVAVKYKR
ncbi:MAG: spore coat protein CotH [Oscillospiraceae bacterium]|jgi:spore coat protein CotH|nr:spore coat protein CotH [Oscillospiraceae bacterium]